MYTRIVVYNGHREISLVVAGHWVPQKCLDLAGRLALVTLCLGKILTNGDGKWPFITFQSLDMALKNLKKV